MLFRGVIDVYCETHTKHVNTVCGKATELFNFTPGGACSYHLSFQRLN